MGGGLGLVAITPATWNQGPRPGALWSGLGVWHPLRGTCWVTSQRLGARALHSLLRACHLPGAQTSKLGICKKIHEAAGKAEF